MVYVEWKWVPWKGNQKPGSKPNWENKTSKDFTIIVLSLLQNIWYFWQLCVQIWWNWMVSRSAIWTSKSVIYWFFISYFSSAVICCCWFSFLYTSDHSVGEFHRCAVCSIIVLGFVSVCMLVAFRAVKYGRFLCAAGLLHCGRSPLLPVNCHEVCMELKGLCDSKSERWL